MNTFLKWTGGVITALFFLAVLALVYAGIAWIFKEVWTH